MTKIVECFIMTVNVWFEKKMAQLYSSEGAQIFISAESFANLDELL